MGAGLAMLGGLSANLGLARIESLIAAMTEITPAYRSQHIASNAAAMRAGAARVPRLVPVKEAVA